MPHVLIASDSQSVSAEVHSVLPASGYDVGVVLSGAEVVPAAREKTPDLVICDLMMAGMGGVATCMELRLEASGGRLPEIPLILLLDRRADVFMARRAGARGWVIKPLDPIRLRRAVEAVLAGGSYGDESYKPPTVPAR